MAEAGPDSGRHGDADSGPVPVLPGALRAWLGSVAALSVLVVALIGVMYAGHSESGRVDRWFVLPTDDRVRPPWLGVALAVDFLGEPLGAVLLVLAAVACCLVLRRPRAAVLVVAAVVLTTGTVMVIKSVVGRTIHGPENLSYPSGHTAFLTALALVGALVAVGRLGLGRAAGACLVFGAALVAGAGMGWAQVALSAHYPTDTVGGWCTALAVVPATAWLVDRVADAGRPARR
ncbi:phosphatase PAP2 family protein [Streptomyces fractus]|uniref:phosphatase PAP2 family protein n=1 Tax=Streptomyces fractus TaxID=641806 RepID=UPI003CF4EBAE